jgi:hypothetical protein
VTAPSAPARSDAVGAVITVVMCLDAPAGVRRPASAKHGEF